MAETQTVAVKRGSKPVVPRHDADYLPIERINMDSEMSEGYLVDIACIRKYPRKDLFEKSEVHSRACALMGHCMESGYGLVNKEGITLLDDEATPMIAEALLKSSKDRGIRIRVERTKCDGEMRTVRAEEIP